MKELKRLCLLGFFQFKSKDDLLNVKASTTQICSLFLVLVIFGCGPSISHLSLADKSYRKAKYEETQFWLLGAEERLFGEGNTQFNSEETTHFHFLQGMTASRLGDEKRARYHLTMAALTAPKSLTNRDQAVLRRLLSPEVLAESSLSQ